MPPSEDHYKGQYTFEHNSLADSYRTRREVLLSLFEQIPEEFKLHFLENQYNETLNDFRESYPETFEKYEAGKAFNEVANILERYDLLEASFLTFLQELIHNQKIVDQYRFVNVKWLSDYEDFIALFKVLKSHSVIESNFPQFKLCFSGGTTVTFLISSMDMSVLLFELERNGKISEYTIESLLRKGCINTTSIKGRIIKTLSYSEYTIYRSKYQNNNENRKPSQSFRKLIDSFGIQMLN